MDAMKKSLAVPSSAFNPGAFFLLLALLFVVVETPAATPQGAATPPEAAPTPPNLLLITLDTTRADALGCYGAPQNPTPNLDSIAARGVRYQRALSASPLTLPAHTSLLTGLAPPEHGVRHNGTAALGSGVATVATVLQSHSYTTGAFVASRVLDHRFGLARGFDHYDDRMAAELVGEYGYPERDAAAVTGAALEWLRQHDGKPFFLWVHYYDPHAPYQPPRALAEGTPQGNYRGEVRHVDQQVGRLLAALPQRGANTVVAVVGDHGEALGEHGERTHGIFLYEETLAVPLLLAGPGVADQTPGTIVSETVASRRLAPTVLRLLGLSPEKTTALGTPLPGLANLWPDGAAPPPQPVYSEATLPASAYGWSALQALSDGRWRLIAAPRPELYDLATDPAELGNLIDTHRREAFRLKQALEATMASFQPRAPGKAADDPELAAALRSLGYATGASGTSAVAVDSRRLDPKDGIQLLDYLDAAKRMMVSGQAAQAVKILEEMNRQSPDNVPFLNNLARAQKLIGDKAGAVATYQQAAQLNPKLDFVHFQLAAAYQESGRPQEAAKEYRLTLELNPRFAGAWLALAEIANRAGNLEEEGRLLTEAVEAGTASASILTRLGQIAQAAGHFEAAEARYTQAAQLLPEWPMGWYLLGKLHLDRGAGNKARQALEKAVEASPYSPQGEEAQRLLNQLSSPSKKPEGGNP
jgi:choline-sulfatase